MKGKINLLIYFVAIVLALGFPGMAMAVAPGSVFELDGNSVVNGSLDDWDPLNTSGQPNHSLVNVFDSEPAGGNVFTGGQTKDPIDIPSWQWKLGATPDKDLITNGYAAAYNSGGDLIIVFGADRFATNGDANIGIWFFQENVAPIGTSGGTFSGKHVNNDVFIVSAFTGGGGTSTISVYIWDDSCTKAVNKPVAGQCAALNLRLKFSSEQSSTCGGGDPACAIVNTAPITVAWDYASKFGGPTNSIPTGGFYEGGIDLSALLGTTDLPCFTSWLIETRSSQTPSSVLKDFVAGAFPLCGMNATKTCIGAGTLNPGGTSINYLYNGTVTNTGFGTLNNVTLVDTPPAGSTNVVFKKGTPDPTTPGPANTVVSTSACPAGAPAGAVCANLGSLSGNNVINWSITLDSTSVSALNNVYVSASTGGSDIVTDPKQATCSASPTNSITITKNCGIPVGYPGNSGIVALPGTQLVTSGGVAAVQVNFSGQICNTGQTPLTGVIVTDNPAATITPATIPTLAAQGQTGDCAKYSGYYMPSGVTAGDLGGASGRYAFTDEIKVTGATATLGSSPGHEATCTSTFASDAQACGGANCNICPAASTCAGN